MYIEPQLEDSPVVIDLLLTASDETTLNELKYFNNVIFRTTRIALESDEMIPEVLRNCENCVKNALDTFKPKDRSAITGLACTSLSMYTQVKGCVGMYNSLLKAIWAIIGDKTPRIALITPYTEQVHNDIRANIIDNGINVCASVYFGLTTDPDIASVSIETIERAVREMAKSNPSAIVISCSGLKMISPYQGTFIKHLESLTETPIITSLQAHIWDLCQTIGVDIKDQGQLCEKKVKRVYNDPSVETFYKEHHTKQTLDWSYWISQNCNFGYKLDLLELCDLGDAIFDPSDPDLGLSQLHHALQTGESARLAFPDKDWLHLTAFIHDLGKGPLAKGLSSILNCSTKETLWSVVGDTHPVGCEFSGTNVHYKYFIDNPDNGKYSKIGIYSEKCGFDNIYFSFGHDEYFAQVLERSGTTLPQEAIYIIRYHSFYPWHAEGGYRYFASEKDLAMLELLCSFQKCDLYSKRNEKMDPDDLLPYYEKLWRKYLPKKLSC